MDTVQSDGKKSLKKQLFETIHARLDSSLVQYRHVMGEKKMNRFLKRTSKELAGEISRETKQAEKRQRRREKKTAKLKEEQRA